MAKEIIFHKEIRDQILEGVDSLADSVRCTLGPKGRNTVIERIMNKPLLTNDGASIAKEIDFPEPGKNIGAKLIQEVSAKTNELAGDGTTTATVLCQSIIHEGIRLLASGANPIELRRGILGATRLTCKAVQKIAQPISTVEDMKKVASISAEDEELGRLVADAFKEVGVSGSITVEESHQMTPGLKITRGIQFNRGYMHEAMVTDQEHSLAALENPYILVTDKKITNHKDLLPILAELIESGRSMLIICETLEGDALTLINMNVMRGLIKVCAVKAPAFGDQRAAMLEDIACLTGGLFISETLGKNLADVKLADLGSAGSVRVERKETSIVDGCGDPAKVQERTASLRKLYDLTEPGFKRDQIKDRLGMMAGGVAVLQAGAASEVEMVEQKLRIEDAIHAVRAAVQEGIVAGGGTAYIDVLPAVDAYIDTLEGDQKTGAKIIHRALEAPLRQIAENCGVEPSVVVEKVRTLPRGTGYNAAEDRYEDMYEAGIVDSVRVTTMALHSAASAASTLLTTEAAVVDAKEEKAEQ